MIQKPVSMIQSNENTLSIVDINGTTVTVILADEKTDILIEKDFANAKEIVKAINTYGKLR